MAELPLPDELVREILLHVAPDDDPACLPRAAVVCKSWRRIIADPAFRRRHRELHRAPSVVGFLRTEEGEPPYASRFVRNHPASGHPAARDLPGRVALDCRHGRALFVAPSPSLGARLDYDLIVWTPSTDEQRCLPWPPAVVVVGRLFNAAVLCSAAAEGCDHSRCHGGPFRVAFVWSRGIGDSLSILTSARVYSSETGNWSEPVSVMHPNAFFLDTMPCPSTLVGGDTLYFRFGLVHALEYRLGAQGQGLSVIEGPRLVFQGWAISLMPTKGGGLGCMYVEEYESSLRLRLWSRDAACGSDGVTRWRKGRAIDLEKLLPDGALPSNRLAFVYNSRIPIVTLLGLAEGTDVVFVGAQAPNHPNAVYMVQLNSGRARKVFDKCTIVIPVTDTSSTNERLGDDASRA